MLGFRFVRPCMLRSFCYFHHLHDCGRCSWFSRGCFFVVLFIVVLVCCSLLVGVAVAAAVAVGVVVVVVVVGVVVCVCC